MNADNILDNLKGYLNAVVRANTGSAAGTEGAGRVTAAQGALHAIKVLEEGTVKTLGFDTEPDITKDENYVIVQVSGRYWYTLDTSEYPQPDPGTEVEVESYNGGHFGAEVTEVLSPEAYKARYPKHKLPRLRVIDVYND